MGLTLQVCRTALRQPGENRPRIDLQTATNAGCKRARKSRVQQQIRPVLLQRFQLFYGHFQLHRQRRNVQTRRFPGSSKQCACRRLVIGFDRAVTKP